MFLSPCCGYLVQHTLALNAGSLGLIQPVPGVVLTAISSLNPAAPAHRSLANHALIAFTRFALPDHKIWITFEALVHRLPVTDHGLRAIMRDPWIGYVERLVLGLYSFAFLSSLELKYRAERDGVLGFDDVEDSMRARP